jgi:hypothetical protein
MLTMVSVLKAALVNINELESRLISSQLRNLGTRGMDERTESLFFRLCYYYYFKKQARQVQGGINYEMTALISYISRILSHRYT